MRRTQRGRVAGQPLAPCPVITLQPLSSRSRILADVVFVKGCLLRQFGQLIRHHSHNLAVAPKHQWLHMLTSHLSGPTSGTDHGGTAAAHIRVLIVVLNHGLTASSTSTGGYAATYSLLSKARSSLASASFFARVQPLSCRSRRSASERETRTSTWITRTGRWPPAGGWSGGAVLSLSKHTLYICRGERGLTTAGTSPCPSCRAVKIS